MNQNIYAVVVGEHNRMVFEGIEIVYHVAEVIEHENYSFTNNDNDVALLKLADPIRWNKHIVPICLPMYDAEVDKTCYTTGWGNTKGVII